MNKSKRIKVKCVAYIDLYYQLLLSVEILVHERICTHEVQQMDLFICLP